MSKGKPKGKTTHGQGYGYNGKGWQTQQQTQRQQQAHKGKGKSKDKSKQPVNICYRYGLEGRYAKDCRVAVYNLNDTAIQQRQQPDPATVWWNDGGQAYATGWGHGNQTTQGQQLVTTAPQGMQTQPQQHGIQQPVQQGQAVSGPLIPMTAETTNIVNAHHDNIIDLMTDSGAATHVCPQWFAPHQLLGDEPQLRTVTNTQIKVHGYKYVIMRSNKQQPIAIPFYVCDVHAPTLSGTRLAEQGFNIQLNEKH